MEWRSKSFSALSALELYKILQVRIDVFMLEQDCLYPECDDKDQRSTHLFGWQDDTCVAYARLLPPEVSYPGCSSIGRVVVHPNYRSHKYGKELMERAIAIQKQQFPGMPIRISAQEYLHKFYTDLGFKVESEVYLEDNIPHQEMALYF